MLASYTSTLLLYIHALNTINHMQRTSSLELHVSLKYIKLINSTKKFVFANWNGDVLPLSIKNVSQWFLQSMTLYCRFLLGASASSRCFVFVLDVKRTLNKYCGRSVIVKMIDYSVELHMFSSGTWRLLFFLRLLFHVIWVLMLSVAKQVFNSPSCERTQFSRIPLGFLVPERYEKKWQLASRTSNAFVISMDYVEPRWHFWSEYKPWIWSWVHFFFLYVAGLGALDPGPPAGRRFESCQFPLASAYESFETKTGCAFPCVCFDSYVWSACSYFWESSWSQLLISSLWVMKWCRFAHFVAPSSQK